MNPMLAHNILIVLVIVVLGKTVVFIRTLFVSYYFGATVESDAYFVANSVPSIVYLAFITSFVVLLLPEYDRQRAQGGADSANAFLSKYLVYVISVSFILSVLSALFIADFVQLLAPSLSDYGKSLAADLGLVLVLSFPFTALCLSLASISTAYKKYYAPHIIPIFSGIFTVISLVLFVDYFGVLVLAVSGVLATVFQSVIQLLIARSYYSFSFKRPIFDDNIKGLSFLAVPVIIGVAIDQVNLIANNVLATEIGTGSLSSLNYAQNLQLTILGVVTTATLTVVYPVMSRLSSQSKDDEVTLTSFYGIRIALLILAPVLFYLAMYVEAFVKIVYFRGKFDSQALSMTSEAMLYYLGGIVFLTIREFLIRHYYLEKRVIIPLVVGVVSVSTNVALSVFLVDDYGVAGLAMANSVAACITASLLMAMLSNFEITIVKFVRSFVFISSLALALLLGWVVLIVVDDMIVDSTVSFFVLAVLFFVAYFIMLLKLRVREAIGLYQFIKSKIVGV